jgi:hypothetical protein
MNDGVPVHIVHDHDMKCEVANGIVHVRRTNDGVPVRIVDKPGMKHRIVDGVVGWRGIERPLANGSSRRRPIEGAAPVVETDFIDVLDPDGNRTEQSWHHRSMPQDDPEKAKLATVDPGDPPALSPEALAVFENLAPLLVEPETLIQGLRYLQQRIPEFVQLTLAEERSMIRAAHLDPEIVDIAIHTAGAWDETRDIFGWTGQDLQRQSDVIRRWDGVERELHALMKGVAGANLQRKHTLGIALLDLYAVLRRTVNRPGSRRAHLRPHVEELRRAFAKLRKRKGLKKG